MKYISVMNSSGRMVIPREICKKFNIEKGDKIEVITVDESEQIILNKLNPSCVICGAEKNLIKVKDKFICESCAEIGSKKQD